MLSIEYAHKRIRLLRIELSLVVVVLYASFILSWQLLLLLRLSYKLSRVGGIAVPLLSKACNC